MIAFSCTHCGMKFSVKDEFAGRQTTCPTCRRPLVVPQAEQTIAFVAPERFDGQLSSLAQAGIAAGVTLGTGHSSMEAHENGQPSLRQLLAGGRNGQRYLLAGEIARGGMGAVLRAGLVRKLEIRNPKSERNSKEKSVKFKTTMVYGYF